jgi:hypothetical protein
VILSRGSAPPAADYCAICSGGLVGRLIVGLVKPLVGFYLISPMGAFGRSRESI